MDNTNPMVHPLPTIMNASWAESGAKFRYYVDGIGETVGRYIKKMDEERIAIGEKLGLVLGKNLFSLLMQFEQEYHVNVVGTDISALIKKVDAYQEIYAANTIRTRYIYEDIPTAMLAFISIGELVGVSVEKMKFVVRLCEEMLDEDLTHRPESRTIESLGLSGMTLDQLLHYATTGVK